MQIFFPVTHGGINFFLTPSGKGFLRISDETIAAKKRLYIRMIARLNQAFELELQRIKLQYPDENLDIFLHQRDAAVIKVFMQCVSQQCILSDNAAIPTMPFHFYAKSGTIAFSYYLAPIC